MPTPHMLSLDQVRALAAPARRSILDALGRTGPCTTSELSTALGVARSGLYYHLEHLEAVELVTQAGERAGTTRPETLFALRHPRICFGSCEDEAYREAVRNLLVADLRALGRTLSGVAASDPTGSSYSVRRLRVRLTDEDLARFHTLAEDLVRHLAEASSRGEGTPQEVAIIQVPGA